MTYELSNEEKASIVEQHLKNLEFSIYNTQLSIIQETSKSSPDQTILQSLNSDLNDITAKKTSLLAELSSLNV